MKDDDDNEESGIAVQRYPCMPSRVALTQMKNRLHLAMLGKKLMKWTAVATGRELRRLGMELYEIYRGYLEETLNAYMLVARCRYFIPDVNSIVTENIGDRAGVIIVPFSRAVSSVKYVNHEVRETEFPSYAYLGIGKGGEVVNATKKAWLELLKRVISLLNLRSAFLTVEQANKSATKI